MGINLIGIVARKQSGKDTIADYLIANKVFQRYSFADPLKRGVKEMFGFTDDQMWGTSEDKEAIDPKWGISPRKILQIVGTELLQLDIHKYFNEGEFNYNNESIGRNIWVHRFKVWYESEKDKVIKDRIESNVAGLTVGAPTLNVVISDLRFPHEEKAIRELGGHIWKIVRPSLEVKDMHASEAEMDLIIPDTTIINDGSLKDLYTKVDNILG